MILGKVGEIEDLVKLFILVAARTLHFFLLSQNILSLEATPAMHPTAPWEVLHLLGCITLAALFPTALRDHYSHTSEIHFKK